VNSTVVSVPVRSSEVKVEGDCAGHNTSRKEGLSLSWRDNKGTQFVFHVTFTGTADSFRVDNMTLHYNLTDTTFPDVTPKDAPVTVRLHEAQEFLSAHRNHSLRCADNKHVRLSGAGAPAEGVVLHLDDLRLQAFMRSTDNVFGEEENCVSPSSSKVVPIAVGCALLALVLIVIAAYLISRRRSRYGYQSV